MIAIRRMKNRNEISIINQNFLYLTLPNYLLGKYYSYMRSLTFTKMKRAGAENDFDNLYTLEQLVSANSGWKVVYSINEKYFIEDIIAYAFIKNGSYRELVPITLQELHLAQSLQEYVLKDGYIGLITPENELVVNEYAVEDINHLNIQAIKQALRKNRIKLD